MSSPLPSAFCERARRARSRTRRPSVGSGTSTSGAAGAGSASAGGAGGASAAGRSTSSMVRRDSSRGVSASSPTRGSAGGVVMVGVAFGRSAGGSCFFLRPPITSPLTAPTRTTAMTTARMTISITRPVSAMGVAWGGSGGGGRGNGTRGIGAGKGGDQGTACERARHRAGPGPRRGAGRTERAPYAAHAAAWVGLRPNAAAPPTVAPSYFSAPPRARSRSGFGDTAGSGTRGRCGLGDAAGSVLPAPFPPPRPVRRARPVETRLARRFASEPTRRPADPPQPHRAAFPHTPHRVIQLSRP